ncbi:peptidoglycan editing factor PgeF [Candidatus Vallotia tarda]|uniref:Purine nucleoside phosphorylase n=1 Tax=Candidatus Vallotiella hemipterorum TaxID=1177213 RepID=A0A916JW45_9BURK|nr:peptidoglycan editing factor PgeF [Candidatus Vallotia tarda]CAG7602659.1 Peptidoglycan editing factor PgeF [Candidatus Vallotia tarda]
MNLISNSKFQGFSKLSLSNCIVPDWRVNSRVHALITTRDGGVSCGKYGLIKNQEYVPGGLNLGIHTGDDIDAVYENRRRVIALVGAHIAWLEQVHGTSVVHLDKVIKTDFLRADASITDRSKVVCAVLVADCMSILICDEDGYAIGAVHAGWRGVVSGIIQRTVESMRALLACRKRASKALHAYFGPSIGPNAFVVGEEVRAAFLKTSWPNECNATNAAFVRLASHINNTVEVYGASQCKYLANLRALARIRLARVGVYHVSAAPHICTFSDPVRFYSYRRDYTTGRMAALIWLS